MVFYFRKLSADDVRTQQLSGWMVQYFIKMMTGEFEGKDTAAVAGVFSDMLANPER